MSNDSIVYLVMVVLIGFTFWKFGRSSNVETQEHIEPLPRDTADKETANAPPVDTEKMEWDVTKLDSMVKNGLIKSWKIVDGKLYYEPIPPVKHVTLNVKIEP